MGDYDRIGCRDCKVCWVLGTKCGGDTVEMLVKNAGKIAQILRLVRDVNVGYAEYAGITEPQLKAYCEGSSFLWERWLEAHKDHRLVTDCELWKESREPGGDEMAWRALWDWPEKVYPTCTGHGCWACDGTACSLCGKTPSPCSHTITERHPKVETP